MIPAAIKVIKDYAFSQCSQLTTVILGTGLEEIGEAAFAECTSLHEILIPHAIKSIKEAAFLGCSQMMTVYLSDGLEGIGVAAFFQCTLLHEILIPPAVKVIKKIAFTCCSKMTTVNLCDGLEEIGEAAFAECTMLQRLIIPPTVKVIEDSAFRSCSSLTSLVFCDEIEKFVSAELMRDWWNHGVHEKSLSTYCFLVKFNTPQRLDSLRLREWQINIHGMLRRIPFVSPEDTDTYFDSINSNVSNYEHYLDDAPILLELAIWKSKMQDQ